MTISRRQFVSQVAAGTSLGIFGFTGNQSRAQDRNPRRLTSNHAVATVHPLATQAATRILQEGGNAIDAAIAAALVLGVVDGHNSGIGGGCLILVRLADGRIRAIDGRETAGSSAGPHLFLRDGVADPQLSQTGPLASGVPGQLAAMDRMHRAHGALPWARLFDPAVSIAEQGHPTSASTAGTLEREADALNRFPASRGVLLKPDGAPLREGELLVQKELAQTLKSIAEHGSDWFYVGEFAKRTCDYLTSIGGVLTASDFARYQALDRSPLAIQYRGYSVIGFPPPSSGGMHIAQMLGMLNPFPVSDTFRSSTVDGYHLIAECMKRAFADRAYWLGDSDFVKIPYGLMDSEYLRLRMTDYSLDRATEGIEHGVPQGIDPLWNPTAENPAPAEDRKHTTHLTVADASGNWVAMTCTVNTSWGSKVMVPGTGVVLNNQMDDFSLAPGTPNAFGLVGSVANAVAPGKRPLSSMSPTLVLDEDQRPCVTCGAAGGPRIISATLQILVRTLDLNQSIPDAIAGTRIHHQWRPDSLAAEIQPHNDDPFGITTSIMEKLTLRGHSIKRHEVIGIAQGIERRGDQLIAAHDPRTHGSSAS